MSKTITSNTAVASSTAEKKYHKKLRFEKRVNRSFGGTLSITIFILLMSVFMIFPVLFIFGNAFKPLDELMLFPPVIFPRRPTLENFLTMYQVTQNTLVPFSRYLFNTIFVTIAGSVSYIFIASLAAFPLAKHNFPGKAILGSVIIWALLFRGEVMNIPQYLIIAGFGMIDTYWALILPYLATTMGVFMMKQFMLANIPDAMLEAAKIDGATEGQTFFSIVMPLVKPGWLTLLIFAFQHLWGSTGGTYIYTESMKMLPTVLNQITAAGIARAGAGATVGLILMIPPVIIYLICQSSIIETMAHSGIK